MTSASSICNFPYNFHYIPAFSARFRYAPQLILCRYLAAYRFDYFTEIVVAGAFQYIYYALKNDELFA